MDQLVLSLSRILPNVKFAESRSFYWSPTELSINYINEHSELNTWSLLHEAAHAMLNHCDYKSDFELLRLEAEAWHKAKEIALDNKIVINEVHIQDCLDTYRDWLHQRSTCPLCSSVCFQRSVNSYSCHNCYNEWRVSSSRFCRPYRMKQLPA